MMIAGTGVNLSMWIMEKMEGRSLSLAPTRYRREDVRTVPLIDPNTEQTTNKDMIQGTGWPRWCEKETIYGMYNSSWYQHPVRVCINWMCVREYACVSSKQGVDRERSGNTIEWCFMPHLCLLRLTCRKRLATVLATAGEAIISKGDRMEK